MFVLISILCSSLRPKHPSSLRERQIAPQKMQSSILRTLYLLYLPISLSQIVFPGKPYQPLPAHIDPPERIECFPAPTGPYWDSNLDLYSNAVIGGACEEFKKTFNFANNYTINITMMFNLQFKVFHFFEVDHPTNLKDFYEYQIAPTVWDPRLVIENKYNMSHPTDTRNCQSIFEEAWVTCKRSRFIFCEVPQLLFLLIPSPCQ